MFHVKHPIFLEIILNLELEGCYHILYLIQSADILFSKWICAMFHVKHGCEIMIYGDVIQKLIMNESIIDDNKLNLAFYKLTE